MLRRILVLSEEPRAGVQPKALLRSANSDIDVFQPAEYSPLPVALGALTGGFFTTQPAVKPLYLVVKSI